MKIIPLLTDSTKKGTKKGTIKYYFNSSYRHELAKGLSGVGKDWLFFSDISKKLLVHTRMTTSNKFCWLDKDPKLDFRP